MRYLLLSVFLASASGLLGKFVTDSVSYEHEGTKLQGYLVYDDRYAGPDKPLAPGVLVAPEWWGLNDYAIKRARQLARSGYVAFALDMYGEGVKTRDPAQAQNLAGQFYGKPLMATRAQAGLDQLLATELVDPTRIAAIGYCFGGTVVQALAYTGAPLAGIVTFHGGLIAPTPQQAEAIRAKILICHGGADGFIEKSTIDALLAAYETAQVDYQFITYAGAVHAFSNPDADSYGIPGVAYNEAADKRSWAHLKDFFAEILKLPAAN